MTLNDILVGESAFIDAVNVPHDIKRRIYGMGIKVGALVILVRKTNSLLQIRLNTTDIILRRDLASQIELRVREKA